MYAADVSTDAPEGLRERKKRETRQAIADAADRLFRVRGFEAVPVADVAREANVSEQTVYNYFPTKEDLVFDRDEEFEAVLTGAIRARPADASVVEPFRVLSRTMLDRIEAFEAEQGHDMLRLVAQSPVLQRRAQENFARYTASAAPLLAPALGVAEDDPLCTIVAEALLSVWRALFPLFGRRLLAGKTRPEIVREVRPAAELMLDRLERAFPPR